MPETIENTLPFALFAWSFALLLPTAAVASVLSALLERSGPIRLRHWAEEAGGRLRRLYDSPHRFVLFRFILSLTTRLAPIGLYVALAEMLARFGRARPAAWSLAVVLVIVAAIEMANRALVGHDPERALRALTRVYRAVLLVLSPVLTLLTPLVPNVSLERDRREDGTEEEAATDEEIEAFIDVGTREGILEPEQGEMLWSIVDFRDTLVRSVMTPRIDMICASVDSSMDVLAERFIESGHSRIPLYQDSIDNIVGILHIRDVLRASRLPDPTPAQELIKPPLFIPETKPLGELLKELQARFQQVAIVVDEYGGTAGLVTVEDLIEEIVGEIMDEHEALAAELEPLEGGYRLDGRAHIDLLEELFEIDIEDPEYETVAGLIFSALGHVPQVGESVDCFGLRFTVEAVADRRIQTVRVERIPAPQAAGEETSV
ncbi:MAG: magnesium and cobalt exporter, family [Acidobacteriota bacterium]|jgi:CBS domain containing-hemolysin-like protein|nr:magnesium and cobalt exporter, family [Acidobacteriota bacterium]